MNTRTVTTGTNSSSPRGSKKNPSRYKRLRRRVKKLRLLESQVKSRILPLNFVCKKSNLVPPIKKHLIFKDRSVSLELVHRNTLKLGHHLWEVDGATMDFPFRVPLYIRIESPNSFGSFPVKGPLLDFSSRSMQRSYKSFCQGMGIDHWIFSPKIGGRFVNRIRFAINGCFMNGIPETFSRLIQQAIKLHWCRSDLKWKFLTLVENMLGRYFSPLWPIACRLLSVLRASMYSRPGGQRR